jgi:hypothetical protein
MAFCVATTSARRHLLAGDEESHVIKPAGSTLPSVCQRSAERQSSYADKKTHNTSQRDGIALDCKIGVEI